MFPLRQEIVFCNEHEAGMSDVGKYTNRSTSVMLIYGKCRKYLIPPSEKDELLYS